MNKQLRGCIIEFTYGDESEFSTGTTSTSNGSTCSLQGMMDMMEDFRTDHDKTIFVSTKPSVFILMLHDRRDKPPILELSQLLDNDKTYIISGVGVIAGKDALQFLWDNDYLVEWSRKEQA